MNYSLILSLKSAYVPRYLSVKTFRRICKLWLILIASLVCRHICAQVVSASDTIATPTPGVGHHYLGMLNETINPENGGISLHLGFPVPAGRKINLPFSFNYNSNQVYFFVGDWHVGFGTMGATDEETFASGGWSYGIPKLNNFTQTISIPGPSGGTNTPDESTICGVTSNYSFTDMEGSSHQLGLSHIFDNAPGYYGSQNYECHNANFAERDTSTTDPIYQAQLTNITPDSSHANTSPASPNDGLPQVAGPDGTVYTFPALSCGLNTAPIPCSRVPTSIEDKDGNLLQIWVITHLTDQAKMA